MRRMLRRLIMHLLGLRSPSEEMARLAEPVVQRDALLLLGYLSDIAEHADNIEKE